MSNSQSARVTGTVLSVNDRSGSKPQADGSFREWRMVDARVLVGGVDICDVRIPTDRDLRPAVNTGRGEQVDWLVSIALNSGQGSGTFLNITFTKDWAEVEALV